MTTTKPERDLEEALVSKLKDLKYEYRPDIRDRATLERNFREKFEGLNRVQRQQRVFKTVKEHLDAGTLHALAMKTMTPAEWAEKGI